MWASRKRTSVLLRLIGDVCFDIHFELMVSKRYKFQLFLKHLLIGFIQRISINSIALILPLVQKYSRPTKIQSLMKEKDFHRMLAALLGVIFLFLLIVIVLLCSQRKREKPNPKIPHVNFEGHKTELDNEHCKPEAGVIEEKGYVIMHFGYIVDCKERDNTFTESNLKVDENKNQKNRKLTCSKEQLQEDTIIPTDVNTECSSESFADACIVRLLLEEVSKTI